MDIFFGSMEVTKVREDPQYTLDSAINSLGGALSLCLGVSLVMIFEVVELALRLIYAICANFFRKL